MSVILFQGCLGGSRVELYCSICHRSVGEEELSVVADMSRRGVDVVCFDCSEENPDKLPQQLYYLDETFLLGLGDKSFACSWVTDGLEIDQEDLRCYGIGPVLWFNLKTGDVRSLASLSSSTYLHNSVESEVTNE